MTGKKPAVFLDRDGVLNYLIERDGSLYSPREINDFVLFPWTVSCLRALANHGFILVVVTNQPDVSRGKMTVDQLNLMHNSLMCSADIDGIYVCPHDSNDGCLCRKPLAGMFTEAAKALDIDFSQSWTIGDRSSDMAAGRAVGTRLIHVTSGQEQILSAPDVIFAKSLVEATKVIIDKKKLNSN